MRRPWLVLALLLSLGVNVGLVGVALYRQRAIARFADRPIAGGDLADRLALRLGLAGGERERFLAQQRELGRAVRDLRPRIARLERELRAELVAPTPDLERIAELEAELAQSVATLDHAFADNVLKTREILDGEAERRFLRFVEHFPLARRRLGAERDLLRAPGPFARRDRARGEPPGPEGEPEPPRR